MEDPVRRDLQRIERALPGMVPPPLRAAGVAFRCVHRAATSRRPPRYRVIAAWTEDHPRPGRRADRARTSIHIEDPDADLLLERLPEFLESLRFFIDSE
ncbi:MAG: hypothetical protein HUU06_14325 [Planctomycetaceae bacterium]|nr:hypothetical protein [Planctomycetaceae bacterium]